MSVTLKNVLVQFNAGKERREEREKERRAGLVNAEKERIEQEVPATKKK